MLNPAITPSRYSASDVDEQTRSLLRQAGPVVPFANGLLDPADAPPGELADREPDRPFTAIPSEDHTFRHAVAEALRDAPTRDSLQSALRTSYPQARVVVQDPLGGIPGAPLKLYVYRDGQPCRAKRD
jgi:hypothetical protein